MWLFGLRSSLLKFAPAQDSQPIVEYQTMDISDISFKETTINSPLEAVTLLNTCKMPTHSLVQVIGLLHDNNNKNQPARTQTTSDMEWSPRVKSALVQGNELLTLQVCTTQTARFHLWCVRVLSENSNLNDLQDPFTPAFAHIARQLRHQSKHNYSCKDSFISLATLVCLGSPGCGFGSRLAAHRRL